MKKIALALVTVLALSSCADAQPDAQEIVSCGGDVKAGAGCAVTIQYNGKPLNCVSWDGSHGETGLSCDFVEYHNSVGASTLN